MVKLVFGLGVRDLGKFTASNKGKLTREYNFWCNVLRRCNESHWLKKPTYTGCSISENFKYFQFFAEWCNSEKGFNNQGWHLDKDIIVRDNKLYGEDTCCFVPPEINSLLTRRQNDRGDLCIGVRKRWSNYEARCNNKGESIFIGAYATEQLAFSAYKEYKEKLIKEIANKYIDQISEKCYYGLLNYQVNFGD